MKQIQNDISFVALSQMFRQSFNLKQIERIARHSKSDYPNYYLDLEGERFAVIVAPVMEMIGAENFSENTRATFESTRQFIGGIESRAKEAGILNGTYAITFSPIKDFSRVDEALQEVILDYIRVTRRLPSAQEAEIFRSRDQFVTIEKIHFERDLVGEVLAIPARWETKSLSRMDIFLGVWLSHARRKLKNEKSPLLLALMDPLLYVSEKHWRDLIKIQSEKKSFHTICRVQPWKHAELLWSLDDCWEQRKPQPETKTPELFEQIVPWW